MVAVIKICYSTNIFIKHFTFTVISMSDLVNVIVGDILHGGFAPLIRDLIMSFQYVLESVPLRLCSDSFMLS